MACEDKMLCLIHKVLDEEASEGEKQLLNQHMAICESCKQHYDKMLNIEGTLNQWELEEPPVGFTEAVMERLPSKRSVRFKWFYLHPVLSAVCCFAILMMGYVYSLWQDIPFQAMVQGQGQLTYAGDHTVVVPKGEIIKGDVIVHNGKVKIEGKVQGNVILINSGTLSASAGHVTGHIEKVDRILDWIWYHIKSSIQTIFMIHWAIPRGGSFLTL